MNRCIILIFGRLLLFKKLCLLFLRCTQLNDHLWRPGNAYHKFQRILSVVLGIMKPYLLLTATVFFFLEEMKHQADTVITWVSCGESIPTDKT